MSKAMGIFGNLLNPLFQEAGSALGGLAGGLFGNKGKEIGQQIGRGGGGLIGGLLPFRKGQVVGVPMVKKAGKAKKPARMVKGSKQAKAYMAKLRKMKK